MEQKAVIIPEEQFGKVMQLIMSLPYHAAKPIVAIIEEHAKNIVAEVKVE